MSATISSNGPLPSRSSLRREEDLINAFEYEEERITNSLFSKLEQLHSEKIQLENTLEMENEAMVNRLNRQIAALRQAQSDQTPIASSSSSHTADSQSENYPESTAIAGRGQSLTPMRASGRSVPEPSTATIIEALRRENDSLRQRLTDTERDYIRVTRMNDIYREELIHHRTRLGMPVDSLIGLSGPSLSNSPAQSLLQPTHLQREGPISERGRLSLVHDAHPSEPRRTASPPNRATGATPIPILPSAPLAAITTTAAPLPMGVPIPRSNSSHQPQRHHSVILSSASSPSASTETSTTTTSPSSSMPPSPFTFSPPTTTLTTNFHYGNRRPRAISDAPLNEQDQDVAFSNGTQLTTPPSSNNSPFAIHLPVIHQHLPMNTAQVGTWGLGPRLSYPSAPPPSLSSSLGSPILSRRNSVHAQHRTSSPPASPTVPNTQDGSPDEDSVSAHNDNGRVTPEPGPSSAGTLNVGTPNVPSSSLRRIVERGARVAETGSLVPRRRAGGRGGDNGTASSRGANRARRGGNGAFT